MVSDIEVYTFRRDMPDEFNDTTIILIDTHNFTTTAIEALTNGAKEVVPLTSIKGGVPKRVSFLAGDDDAKIDNHPKYMTKENVKNEYVGIDSRNGSSAVHEIRNRTKQNVDVYLASLTNSPSMASKAREKESITFVLAGSDGNIPPEDIITMQCIYQCLYSDSNELNSVCKIYEKLYDMFVLNIYDALYKDKTEVGIFGYPENHAIKYASNIGSKSIIPKMNNNGGFE